MKKLTRLLIMALALVKYAAAQEQLTIKQRADQLFERYQYSKSVQFYLKLVTQHRTDVQILERIADCYRNINHYEEAETFYGRAVADVKASRISHFYYAEVLLRDQKFEKAKQQYQIYFSNDVVGLARNLAKCDSAVLWMSRHSGFKVKNEAALNSEYSDWGLSYDGKSSLIFTSDRIIDDNTDERTGNNWFKLFEAPDNSSDVKQLSVAADDSEIFAGNYHVGPIAFNRYADTAYITVTTEATPNKIGLDKPGKKNMQHLYTRRLMLVMASKKNDQWVIFSSFPYNNIQQYSIGDAALSNDGKLLYFTSDMPGGEGKTDIWFSEKQADGTWGKPVNCGKTINTSEEDAFPTIGGSGALYYSSKGLGGMGGYDIYKAVGQKTGWTAPINLEYPINTTSDDFYLVTRDGLSGYLSSNREGGKGSDDIYSFVFNRKQTVPVKKDSFPAKLITRTDTGIPQRLLPAKPEPGYVLGVIYYDLDKSNIRPDAAAGLDQVIEVLNRQPALKIDVCSYTDSRASDSYNLALSQRRAKAAVAYLIIKGIAETRLTARFYGEANLVNNCGNNVNCTEAEHQLNRRTEFRVMGN